jgi:predicted metal-dependent peptidase
MIPGKKKIKGFSTMMIVDESGSMSDDEVNMAFAYAKKIVLRENNDRLYLVHWDTEPLDDLEELQHESDIDEIERQKCGGTDFKDFYIHEIFHRYDYDLYICITDGYPSRWPKTDAGKPMVWIITQKGGYEDWQKNHGKDLAVCVHDENDNNY